MIFEYILIINYHKILNTKIVISNKINMLSVLF